MPKFFVQSAGRMIPLEDAVWVRWAPCGCASGSVSAMMPDGITPVLTEDSAFKLINGKASHPARLVDRLKKKGFKVSLVTEARYIEVMHRTLQDGCPHTPQWSTL